MATVYKVLGQANPAATTATTLYGPVPGSPPAQAVLSSITVCNTGSTATTYRIAVRPSNAALAKQHYLVYDANLPANTTVAHTVGVTMGTGDYLTVYAGNADLAFSAFGSEVS